MKNSIFVFTTSAIVLFSVISAEAQIKKDSVSKSDTSTLITDKERQDTIQKDIKSKVVGGAEMLPSKDIVDNTSQSK